MTENMERKTTSNSLKALLFCFLPSVLCFLSPVLCSAEEIITSHAITLYGEDPKYKANFTHFDYVNPDAPKGGTIKMGAGLSSFDNFNPFSLKGTTPRGLGLLSDSLLVASLDEPFTKYGLIAEKMEYPKDPKDRSWITFYLRPKAKFQDGISITAEDVVFSFNALRKQLPQYKAYYKDVVKVEALDPRRVKFTFKNTDNRELPLIIGQFPIYSKKFWSSVDLNKTFLTLWPGSGAYRIARFDPGRSITYERIKDYWGKDIPVNKGQLNFDKVVYDYYRDGTVELEAFKAGDLDLRYEATAKYWATAYDMPEIEQGLLIKESIPNKAVKGMQAWIFNLRKPIFQDRHVREAIGLLFDFEWSNKNLMYGQYQRLNSFWDNSELGVKGHPSPEELIILEPYQDRILEEVFTKVYKAPTTDGSGNIRPQLRKATELLKAAGWHIKNGVMTHKKTNQPLRFTFLGNDERFTPITLTFIKNLEKIGIQADIQIVDDTRFIDLARKFNYDIIVDSFPQSNSPGNEQRDFWGSEAASKPNSRNSIGIQNPVIDDLIEKLILAPDRQSLINYTRALDRILLWEHYVIPHYTSFEDHLVYWNKFSRPRTDTKLYTTYAPPENLIFTWWVDPEKEKTLAQKRHKN